MADSNFIASVDIGSSKIVVLLAELKNNRDSSASNEEGRTGNTIITEQFSKYAMSFCHGQVLAVQMSSVYFRINIKFGIKCCRYITIYVCNRSIP
jgi:hypothetical protein